MTGTWTEVAVWPPPKMPPWGLLVLAMMLSCAVGVVDPLIEAGTAEDASSSPPPTVEGSGGGWSPCSRDVKVHCREYDPMRDAPRPLP